MIVNENCKRSRSAICIALWPDFFSSLGIAFELCDLCLRQRLRPVAFGIDDADKAERIAAFVDKLVPGVCRNVNVVERFERMHLVADHCIADSTHTDHRMNVGMAFETRVAA